MAWRAGSDCIMFERGARCASLLSLAAMLAMAVLVGCKRHASESGAPDEEADVMLLSRADVARVERGAVSVGPSFSGRIEFADKANVRAEIGGPILRVGPARGESVREGDLLAEIDKESTQAGVSSGQVAVRSAQKSLQVAQSELARTKGLIAQGAMAPNAVDGPETQVAAARAQLEQARAGLASAREAKGAATVLAPMDGIVSQREVDPGDVVTPGQLLFSVVDPTSVQLEADAPPDTAGALIPGAPVAFTVRGYSQTFHGQVSSVVPVAEAQTRQIPFIVAIDPPRARTLQGQVGAATPDAEVSRAGEPTPQLFAGLFAQGRVITRASEGLLVPSDAVEMQAGQPTVLAVRDGAVRRVRVQTGLVDPETSTTQVLEGLRAGEFVLVGITGRQTTPGTRVSLEELAGQGADAEESQPPATPSPNIGGGPPDSSTRPSTVAPDGTAGEAPGD